MKKFLLIFFSLYFSASLAQETILVLNKIDQNIFNIDGVISEDEINKAKTLEIIYEAEPGLNSMPSQETTGYITYSDKFLYVGIKAKRERVIAPLTTRDNSALFRGDFAGITIDSYGDARNNILLISNPSGSQTDGIRLPGTSFGGGLNINLNINFDFQSSGSITDEGYEIEFLIPLSELPFPNGKDQSWKFEIYTGYIDDENEGVEVRAASSRSSRDASCQLCLIDHIIVMNDIEIEKKLDFLPYVSSNISGKRDKYYDRINYETPELNYGIGVNIELNKNLSLEATLNPDFSQVESDATKIDINSPTAINYPEKRPFFNRGIDAMDYEIDVFYSRSINNPSFASKIINQGRKSRLYVLSAFDEETPYLVPTQFESFSGVGGKSFSNVIRYQNFLDSKTRIGLLASNRYYEGDAYGNLYGMDALVNFSDVWKFEFELFLNNNKEPFADWIDSDKKYGDRSVQLDGETINGNAVYATVRRDTETWRSFIEYSQLSDGFRSDLGFITTNNQKKYTLWHSYNKYPNKDFIKRYRISLRQDFEYSYSHDISRSNFQTFLGFLTILNTDVLYNYEYNFVKSHLEFQFRDFINHWLRVDTQPFDFLNINIFYKWGKDIAYRLETPMLGMVNDIRLSSEISINDNFRIRPNINYSSIKKLDSEEYYFKGYISRLDIRYQFTNSLDLRLISEYNDFSEQFFFQPLISWRPNPDTIFYLGGNQNYIDQFTDYNSPHYRVNKTQLFLKFQYLLK
tara:strand:+ start:1267 stop:3501 length:2235 start_codon:yes stop_codon:yes gene_type:complete